MKPSRSLLILSALVVSGACALAGDGKARAADDEGLGSAETRRPGDLAALRRLAYEPGRLRRRREAVARQCPSSVIMVTAAPAPRQDYDPYRPSPDFLYLTGVEKGPAALVMLTDAEGALSRDILLLPKRNRFRERWEGPRPSVDSEKAAERGYSEILPVEELSELVAGLLKTEGLKSFRVSGRSRQELEQMKLAAPSGAKLVSARPAIAEGRLTKDAAELALLQRSIDITCSAQIEAMRSIAPGQFEYEVQAVIEHTFLRFGAPHPAFESICGSGPKSCVLHYTANRRQTKPGDLIVMDIGANVLGYCADVTRTVPVSGRFTPRQREIYEIVLEAQAAGIAAVKPGATIGQVHRAAYNVIAKKGYARYFFHGTSHWLGLETHDVPAARRGAGFKPGMVLTVEPGIYIAAEELGVRIEDDVVVTEDGCEVMSKRAPRSVEEIEALMARRGGLGLHKITPIPRRALPGAKATKPLAKRKARLY